jgi:hypothetical protein
VPRRSTPEALYFSGCSGRVHLAGCLSGRNRYLPAMQEITRLWANTWPFLIPVLYFVIGLAFGMLNNPE